MSGRRRLRLSQETIRYPSRDSVSLKNPEEIPLHLQKTGLMGDCRECSLRGDGDPFDRLVQKSIRKILLDISDFSSIIFFVRKMGSLYPPWRTRGLFRKSPPGTRPKTHLNQRSCPVWTLARVAPLGCRKRGTQERRHRRSRHDLVSALPFPPPDMTFRHVLPESAFLLFPLSLSLSAFCFHSPSPSGPVVAPFGPGCRRTKSLSLRSPRPES